MRLSINPKIFETYPNLLLGVIVCKNIQNRTSSPEIETLLRSAEKGVQAAFPNPDTFKDHPMIANWQEAHRAFGNNPNKYQPSIQALVKRVLKGNALPLIHPLVDVYNVVSLQTLFPIGGEDLDACQGDIQLTYAEGGESFLALGETEEEAPEAGEIVYKDDIGVLCRKWNWREAVRTCVTEKTTNAILVIEALPPARKEDMQEALKDLSALVRQFCGGDLRIEIMDRERQNIDL